MSDQNVKAAQKYLNAMFGGHKDWVKLDEDGKTGTAAVSYTHLRHWIPIPTDRQKGVAAAIR